MNRTQISALRSALLGWGREHFAPYPWRSTKNMWHALAAEVMLQRTGADQVLPVYLDFSKRFPGPADYLKSGEHIFTRLGLHWREETFRSLARRLIEAPVTSTMDDYTHLPGVGPYISAALRSLHLCRRDVLVDSNVVRLYGRYFGFKTDGETRRKKWLRKLGCILTPQKDHRVFNYALIDFTRSVCLPRQPKCAHCPLKNTCHYYKSVSLRKQRPAKLTSQAVGAYKEADLHPQDR